MVWVDVVVANNTPWLLKQTKREDYNRNGAPAKLKSSTGNLNCQPNQKALIKLLPTTSLLGLGGGNSMVAKIHDHIHVTRVACDETAAYISAITLAPRRYSLIVQGCHFGH